MSNSEEKRSFLVEGLPVEIVLSEPFSDGKGFARAFSDILFGPQEPMKMHLPLETCTKCKEYNVKTRSLEGEPMCWECGGRFVWLVKGKLVEYDYCPVHPKQGQCAYCGK